MPPFFPSLPLLGLRGPVRQESACRLHEASETKLPAALGAAGPLIGRGCCFHGDPQQSLRPPLPAPPPHRPYSVARAATGRLIKQEPREEPGCGPRSQHGGPPRREREGWGWGVRTWLAALSVPFPLQPIEGTRPTARSRAVLALGKLGVQPLECIFLQWPLEAVSPPPSGPRTLNKESWGWGWERREMAVKD